MPSVLHEAVADLFRQRPRLAADLLTLSDECAVPEFDHARLESGDFPDIDPTEYRADAVVALTNGNSPVLAVVIEVQLRPDPEKGWSWPVYLTTLRARLRCPTVLLVLCADDRTAARCRRPLLLAPRCTLVPVVFGPADVPVITDRAQVGRNPELAVLSAVAHRNHPDREQILAVFAAEMVDVANGQMYIDLVLAILPRAARKLLETLMATGTYQYKSEFARRYYAEGEAKGEASALLTILRARQLPVPEEVEQRVLSCSDLDLLSSWVRRAATAATIEEVFEE
ncbi:hypothetical protein [Nocardia miyunensis]|uniref:hypothetical protein n=1 Tax=Nocardia miyunensis TaxID=282684 RepID=UPI00082A360D|nr:hypothetical protein [Nocardia miyunensis]